MKGVIQIGAHYAEEYEGWVSIGIQNFIFFEPVKANFDKLKKIMEGKFEDILLFNLALGNMKGQIKMFIETSHQGKSCSILRPKLHLEQYPDIKFISKEWVKIDKLDNIQYDISLYDHLHIDCQGYELEVLKGAHDSLEFIQTIQVEVYRKELYEDCPMVEEIVNYLKIQGFEQTELFWRGLSWGDAKFKRI